MKGFTECFALVINDSFRKIGEKKRIYNRLIMVINLNIVTSNRIKRNFVHE